jgi:hypothetical protein
MWTSHGPSLPNQLLFPIGNVLVQLAGVSGDSLASKRDGRGLGPVDRVDHCFLLLEVPSLMMPVDTLSKNSVLAGLPRQERDLLFPACEMVEIHLGDTIAEAGMTLPFVYFPVNSVISMTAMQDREHMVEVTLTGKEGSSGSSVVLGDERSTCTAMVQIPGIALRIRTSAITGQASRIPYLHAALSRHNLLLMRTAVISVGCSRFHAVPQRMARWLKAHWHRTGIESFPFSAQFLAAQVGADYKIVAEALKTFHENNILKIGRNTVTIVDQEALGKEACECYGLAKQAAADYMAALAEIARTHADS